MSWNCTHCGKMHGELPDIGAAYPDYYFGVPESERTARVYYTPDTCVIDNEDFFIRGVIEIPLTDSTGVFGLGAWVSQKRENFQKYLENWESADIGPFFGWLSNRYPFYPISTINLKTMAHFRGGKSRPLIKIDPADHPLALDQQHGIAVARAWEIVHMYMK